MVPFVDVLSDRGRLKNQSEKTTEYRRQKRKAYNIEGVWDEYTNTPPAHILLLGFGGEIRSGKMFWIPK